MAQSEEKVLVSGLGKLVGSQVFTRVATFGLNQIVTKALSVEAYGLLSIRFHLINTSILTLSREGLRRGCLRSQQDGAAKAVDAAALLRLSSLSVPLGAAVTLFGCWFFGSRPEDGPVPGYQSAILLQGAAAMVELLSEPLYILAQARLRIGLRVRIEAAATVAKIAATLSLLWLQLFSEAVALSVAQLAFAAVILFGYLWHYYPEFQSWLSGVAATQQQLQKRSGAVATGGDYISHRINARDFLLCCSFTGQACEKLLLAEGTKIAMTKVQSAYDQGVYGLVVNLGSVAVRTLFQPFEEAAFMAFSRPLPGAGDGPQQRLRVLFPLVKVALLFGLLATAFGPSNTYLLLHLLYGTKYSATEAPTALALYCPYILLLAANGILESFVHAVSQGRELLHGHIALVIITALQTGVTFLLVEEHGTVGMIAADAVGMLLRIAYCACFIAAFAARHASVARARSQKSPGASSRGSAAVQQTTDSDKADSVKIQSESGRKHTGVYEAGLALWQSVLPSAASCASLVLALQLSAASAALCFGQGLLAGLVPQRLFGFWRGAAVHVSVEACLLAAVVVAVFKSESVLWRALKAVQQKQH